MNFTNRARGKGVQQQRESDRLKVHSYALEWKRVWIYKVHRNISIQTSLHPIMRGLSTGTREVKLGKFGSKGRANFVQALNTETKQPPFFWEHLEMGARMNRVKSGATYLATF